ncbi:MAG: glycosyltransferase family 2 protein [Candidatus Nanoarchaeia archaeon]|nr:glycosyltransferase family 2 protein [Candidatus Nanoarchaeia archaeon]MDD5358160.1 glycosyltransferase family 2 protein [Candidatus Nanoarchaeia archaeon]MDD5589347.1 glycosyltransferase family 2 protein [Candidatus Nanoarchaeia archaeon]
MENKKVSIVIPVYNEEGTIAEVIEKTKKLELLVRKEIIVVDDGSSDGSYEIARKIRGIKLVKHEVNRGKGAAIKTGLEHSTGDIFIVQDADMELDPKEIPKIIMPIVNNEAQVVYGSRNPSIWKINKQPLFYLGGILITKIANILYHTKLTDEPCGYKAFDTNLLKSIKTEEDGFGWEPEITAKIAKRGIKIYEVIIDFNSSRTEKEGKKLRASDGLKAAYILIKYKFRN